MIPLEYELDRLKTITLEMLELVKDQMHLTKEALLTNEQELASEIMRKETRVNSYELTLDRECEDFFALHAPVAADLRFVMATLKTASNLERIGDHAYRISSFVFDDKMKVDLKLVEATQIPVLFDEIDIMMENLLDAIDNQNVKSAKKVFKQDKLLNKVNKQVPKMLEEFAQNHNAPFSNLILVSRTIGKLERSGDLLKNIAEDTIFHIESKVLKHKKKNKKIHKIFDEPEKAKENK